MMQTDVKYVYASETGVVYDGPTRIKAVYINSDGTEGALAVTDGDGGNMVFALDIPETATNNPIYLPLPGEGIRCMTGVYISLLTGVNSVTILYG